jgi:hypothetical protein
LVEPRIVDPVVVGSSPIIHPIIANPRTGRSRGRCHFHEYVTRAERQFVDTPGRFQRLRENRP